MGQWSPMGSDAYPGDLSALDEGRYAQAIAAYGVPAESPEPLQAGAVIWRAEVALYLGRLDEAHAAVTALPHPSDAQVRAVGPGGALARRGRLILAEILFFNGRLAEAEALVAPLVDIARGARDSLAEMRARYNLGRCATKRSEHALAIEHLAGASRIASELGNDFYQGLIAFHRAVSLYELNETAAAERRCVESILLLEQTENLRYRALAQSVYGALLSDLGRYSEGLAALECAEATAAELGIARDLQSVRANVARAMLSLGRYEEAVNRLEQLLEYGRSAGDHDAELHALGLMAHAELARGRAEAAERAASEAMRLAALVGSPDEVLDARQVAARARGRLGQAGAVDELRSILADADAAGTEQQQAEARIYLAEALIDEDPIDAWLLLTGARLLSVATTTEWLQAELDRVERDRLRAPVHVAPEGTLVIDPRLGWPKLKTARDTLERFLVEAALAATDGNGAAAGRLLGETRYQMHYLKRIFDHGEGRPSRATRSPDEPTARPPAARPKRLVRRK